MYTVHDTNFICTIPREIENDIINDVRLCGILYCNIADQHVKENELFCTATGQRNIQMYNVHVYTVHWHQ